MKTANLNANTALSSHKSCAPDAFNILRAVAILCVFGLHAVILSKAARPGTILPAFLYTPAWLSMWMLFALSGFLLGKRFYCHQYEGAKGSWNFICRRFKRLAPSYFFFLLIVLLFHNPLFFISNGWLLDLRLISFTYNGIPGIDGVGATWFVSTIMQLYVMLPFFYHFLLKKISVRYTLWVWGAIVLLGLGVRLVSTNLDWYVWTYTFSVANLDIFLAPFVLNAFCITYTQDTSIRRWCRRISPVLLCGLIVFCTYCVYSNKYFAFYQRVCPSLALVLVSQFCYGFSAFGKNKLHLPVLLNRPLYLLDLFGVMSFSFYLYHSNVLCVLPKVLPPLSNTAYVWASVGGGGILSLLTGFVMYRLIEHKEKN